MNKFLDFVLALVNPIIIGIAGYLFYFLIFSVPSTSQILEQNNQAMIGVAGIVLFSLFFLFFILPLAIINIIISVKNLIQKRLVQGSWLSISIAILTSLPFALLRLNLGNTNPVGFKGLVSSVGYIILPLLIILLVLFYRALLKVGKSNAMSAVSKLE